MGLNAILKREDVPSDVMEVIKNELSKFQQIKWLLQPKSIGERTYEPPYGKLVKPDKEKGLLGSIGEDVLVDVVKDLLDLIESTVGIYEVNGDYTFGFLTSGWCKFLDIASRDLCETEDNEKALTCGKWHCHEWCWTQASKVSIETGQPVDIECLGGINIYAVPIWAGGEIVGAINVGYGDPPTDFKKIQDIAEKYKVRPEDLLDLAKLYESRPNFIIDMAKNGLEHSARVLGTLVELKQGKEALQRKTHELGERVKELTCLYGFSKLTADPHRSMDDVIRETLLLIPPAWQYPEVTCARIVIDGKTYSSPAFQETPWKQSADIPVRNTTVGVIEVYYRGELPKIIKSPFLREERDLIEALARELGKFKERKRAEEEIERSESRWRSLLQNIPSFVAELDLDGKILSFNRVQPGLSREDFVGKTIFGITPLEGLQDLNFAFSTVLKDHKPVTYEYSNIGSKGTQSWYHHHLAPILTEENELESLIVVVTDITKIKKAEEAVRQSEEQLRAFMDSATDGFVLLDSQLNFIDLNTAALANLGFTKDEMIGKNLLHVYPQLKESDSFMEAEKVIQTGEPLTLDSFHFRGKYFSVRAFKVGEGLGVMTLDVTEQKRGEEARIELEQRRDNFVWMTSHELRTPLTVIKGYFAFLEKNIANLDQDRQEKIFTAINSNLSRLENLVDEVSLLAQFEQGIFKIEKSEFDFYKFFQEVRTEYKTLLGKRFEVDAFQMEFPLIIDGDHNRLRQVFDNLVNNAINHTHHEHRLIKLSLAILPLIIRITLTDNGAGIVPDNLERVFEQFVSIETEYSTFGTGIGLYLCRKIMKAHGGTITAKSQGLGHGSTFIVELPIENTRGLS